MHKQGTTAMQSPVEFQSEHTEHQSDTEQPSQKQPLPPRVGWLRRLVGDVFFVAKRDKKWWLMPLIFLLFSLAALIGLATLAGPLAPFIYPLL